MLTGVPSGPRPYVVVKERGVRPRPVRALPLPPGVFPDRLQSCGRYSTWKQVLSVRAIVEGIVEAAGYACPIICTPEELMED